MEGFENNIPKKSDIAGATLDKIALQNKAEMTQEEIEALKEQITEAETLLEQQTQEIQVLGEKIDGLVQKRGEDPIATENADLERELNETLSIIENLGGTLNMIKEEVTDFLNVAALTSGATVLSIGVATESHLTALAGATVIAATIKCILDNVTSLNTHKTTLESEFHGIINKLNELNPENPPRFFKGMSEINK